MKIAIIHDWLVAYAGAEKVLEQILLCYPNADIFTIVDFMSESDRDFLEGKKITTSFIQRFPRAKTKYRTYFPFMALAVEQFDLSKYQLIISSSHAVAKGVLTGPDQVHISYVHSPMRYAWDLQHEYLKSSGLTSGFKGFMAKWVLHKMRVWDLRTANGVDHFIANSEFIARRIWKVYRRKSSVIYPPVNTVAFPFLEQKDDFYLTASRLVPYKRIDLIVEAFSMMPDKKLVVIGSGPELNKIKCKALGNIKIMGYQSFDVLKSHMQKAKAFVFAAEEDFGITPVEAQACGTPVIAYKKGGVCETVIESNGDNNATGVFFNEQSVSEICRAVNVFEKNHGTIFPSSCRAQSLNFSEKNFRIKFMQFVSDLGLS